MPPEIRKPRPGAPHVLAMSGLSKRYGGVRALRDGRLTIERAGEVHALVGANGSGKSTLLGILSGQIVPDAGEIRLNDAGVVLPSAHSALAHGIVMVSQETAVAGTLTVAENILLGHRQVRGLTGINWRATRAKALGILHRLGLDLDPDARVRTLPPDQQQLVEIARALSTDASLVILDEPTSSLTLDQVQTLSAAIRKLADQDVSVLLVSHRFAELYDLCSRVTVLRDGSTVLEAQLADMTPDQLLDAMVGSARETPVPASTRRVPTGPYDKTALLRLRGLSSSRQFLDVDLDVARGEIVGLAGLVGSGRSELLEAVFGVRETTAGTVAVNGTVVDKPTPRSMIAHGIGYLPPDRKVQGLVLQQNASTNLLMVASLPNSRMSVPNRPKERSLGGDLATRLHLKSGGLSRPVSTLSGGNQQKVAIGKWLATDARVLLLDEPTRGVDVAAKAEIHGLLRDIARRGASIVVSSSEDDELLRLCDRILVMSRGHIIAELSPDEASEETIAGAAGGHR